jgi:hypothetical protein
MNDHEDSEPKERGRELVPDSWSELDDTLADGPLLEEKLPTAVPPAAMSWLAAQRCMHGLLRALHTQDAAAREGRVDSIMACIDGLPRVEPRGRWLTAVAALLMACFGIWLVLPASLPTAEAAVQRAVHELARDVSRRFQLVATGVDGKGQQVARHQFALVVRPGGLFRLNGRLGFGTLQLGEITIGCDGQEIWMLGGNGFFQRVVPIAERDRLNQMTGRVVDLGYLDVHDLVRKLPTDFELAVVGRETDAAGRRLLRINATRKSTAAQLHLKQAWLLCDEVTGMVTRLEAEVERAAGGSQRNVDAAPGPRYSFSMEYLGEEPAGLAEFGKPW